MSVRCANAFTLSALSPFTQQSNGHSSRDRIDEIRGGFLWALENPLKFRSTCPQRPTALRHSYARTELSSAAFSRDPLADISRAVPQSDAFRFAASEKADGTA